MKTVYIVYKMDGLPLSKNVENMEKNCVIMFAVDCVFHDNSYAQSFFNVGLDPF